jgi:hypothetical protein
VHGNPINNTDPTGMFASIMEANLGLALATILSGYGVYNANANLLRSVAGSVAGSAGNAASSLTFQTKLLLSLLAIKSFIVTQDSDGKTNIPIVFYGDTVFQDSEFKSITNTTKHVTDAIFSGKEFVLSAWGGDNPPGGHGTKGQWYNATSFNPSQLGLPGDKIKNTFCSPISKGLYLEANGFPKSTQPGPTCDEYPFFSSEQGGRKNFVLGRVSLGLVPNAESGPQGTLMGKAPGELLRSAGVVPGDEENKWYGVVPISSLPISFWRTRQGGIIFR